MGEGNGSLRDYTGEGISAFHGGLVQVNNIPNSVLVLLVLVGTVAGISVGVAWHAADKATIAEREARLLQRRNDDNELEIRRIQDQIEELGNVQR